MRTPIEKSLLAIGIVVVSVIMCSPFIDGIQGIVVTDGGLAVHFSIFFLDGFAWMLAAYVLLRFVFCPDKNEFRVAGLKLHWFMLLLVLIRLLFMTVLMQFYFW
jgi:hypothetical protein